MAKKSSLSYTQTHMRKLQATGMLDIEAGTIDIDEQAKKILTLLSDFDGCNVVLSVQVKNEESLDAPEENIE